MKANPGDPDQQAAAGPERPFLGSQLVLDLLRGLVELGKSRSSRLSAPSAVVIVEASGRTRPPAGTALARHAGHGQARAQVGHRRRYGVTVVVWVVEHYRDPLEVEIGDRVGVCHSRPFDSHGLAGALHGVDDDVPAEVGHEDQERSAEQVSAEGGEVVAAPGGWPCTRTRGRVGRAAQRCIEGKMSG